MQTNLIGSLILALLVAVAWIATTRHSAPELGRTLASTRAGFTACPGVTRHSLATFAEAERKPIRQKFEGRIVGDGMQKSRTVRVERLVRHPKYHKRMRLSKNFIVDDPTESTEVGDVVQIASIKPMSKRKAFEIVEVVRKVKK
eukprot:CAMPEP_0185251342 /NCGR_PEP_ID=MMETSP1359-20130426/755_1 /TAXON_ID=552665 /ORGANISM="Bigelowiella longifila, Strain CCMP242" /LENGTH=143 /DNA_ID=CAMNT_0027833189 /DNA_START=39 /DNA_END=470 /DNA_ORIENTATION=+